MARMTGLNSNTTFKSYLINLDGSADRLASARRQFETHKIAFERVSAVNGHKLSLETLKDYNAQKTECYMGRQMSGGEIGCVLSHLKALREFLASDAPYAIVFEDDFLLHDDFLSTVNSTIDWLSTSNYVWDIVHLSFEGRKYSRPRARVGKSELRHTYYFPMTSTAILWSREGAEAFLEFHREILAPYDNILREWQSHRGKGLALYPPIASTIGGASDIDGGKPRNRNRKSSILYGIRKKRRSIVLKWRAMSHILQESKKTALPVSAR